MVIWMVIFVGIHVFVFFFSVALPQKGSLYYQPKQCVIIKQIHQNHHIYVYVYTYIHMFPLIDSPQKQVIQ